MVAARFVVVGQRVERFEADPARRHHVNSQRTRGYIGMRMNNSRAGEAVSGRDQAEEEVKWTAHRGVDGREDRGASPHGAVTGAILTFVWRNRNPRTGIAIRYSRCSLYLFATSWTLQIGNLPRAG